MKRICVYCGSSNGRLPAYATAAAILGRALADSDISLVYGGASVGLMGVIADAVLEAGGEVSGVIPRSLEEKELAHAALTELHVVESMHERKSLMAMLSDGFIALPGGYGTLEELVETLTWGQLQFHDKPCGLLNIDGYFDTLLAFFDHAAAEGFIKSAHRGMLMIDDDPHRLINRLERYMPPESTKW